MPKYTKQQLEARYSKQPKTTGEGVAGTRGFALLATLPSATHEKTAIATTSNNRRCRCSRVLLDDQCDYSKRNDHQRSQNICVDHSVSNRVHKNNYSSISVKLNIQQDPDSSKPTITMYQLIAPSRNSGSTSTEAKNTWATSRAIADTTPIRVSPGIPFILLYPACLSSERIKN